MRISGLNSVIESKAYTPCVFASFCVSLLGRPFTIGAGVVEVSLVKLPHGSVGFGLNRLAQ